MTFKICKKTLTIMIALLKILIIRTETLSTIYIRLTKRFIGLKVFFQMILETKILGLKI